MMLKQFALLLIIVQIDQNESTGLLINLWGSNATAEIYDENNEVSTISTGDYLANMTVLTTIPDDANWTRRIIPKYGECQGNDDCPVTAIQLDYVIEDNYTYFISLVDGFSAEAHIAPMGESADCKTISCTVDLNQICPEDNQVLDSTGTVIACKADPELFQENCPDVITAADDASNAADCDIAGFLRDFISSTRDSDERNQVTMNVSHLKLTSW